MLEPVWNRDHLACVQITMAESFGVEDRGHFYDPVGALRDVVVNHIMQVVAVTAMEAPAGGDPETLKDAQLAVFRAVADRRPRPLRPRPVRRLPRHRGRRRGLDDRDLRRPPPRHRQLALVGRSVLHPHGKAPAGHPDRGQARVRPAPQAGLQPARTSNPEPNQLVDQARPHDRDQAAPRRPARRVDRARGHQPRHGVRRGGGRGRHALRGAAPRRDGRPEHALHAPGRCRGDVADHAAAPRCAAARPQLRAGIVGAGGGRRHRRRPGGWHTPWLAS